MVGCIFNSHADGSVKFWDASGCNLVFLYKLGTNRLFDRIQSNRTIISNNNRDLCSNIKLDTKSRRANSSANDEQQPQMLLNENNPFSIYSIKMCDDGKYLAVAGLGGHVTLFQFMGSELDKADEGLGDLPCLEIPICHKNLSNNDEDTNIISNTSIINDLQPITIKQTTDKKVMSILFQ